MLHGGHKESDKTEVMAQKAKELGWSIATPLSTSKRGQHPSFILRAPLPLIHCSVGGTICLWGLH